MAFVNVNTASEDARLVAAQSKIKKFLLLRGNVWMNQVKNLMLLTMTLIGRIKQNYMLESWWMRCSSLCDTCHWATLFWQYIIQESYLCVQHKRLKHVASNRNVLFCPTNSNYLMDCGCSQHFVSWHSKAARKCPILAWVPEYRLSILLYRPQSHDVLRNMITSSRQIIKAHGAAVIHKLTTLG